MWIKLFVANSIHLPKAYDKSRGRHFVETRTGPRAETNSFDSRTLHVIHSHSFSFSCTSHIHLLCHSISQSHLRNAQLHINQVSHGSWRKLRYLADCTSLISQKNSNCYEKSGKMVFNPLFGVGDYQLLPFGYEQEKRKRLIGGQMESKEV